MTDARQTDTLLEVTDDLHFSGQANGGGVVRSGAHLHLAGEMNGRLVVEDGASARLAGRLNGPAEIRGRLDVTGQLHGLPQVAESGQLTFATGSSIVRAGQTLVVSHVGKFQPLPRGATSYTITDDTPRWIYQHDGTLYSAREHRP